MVQSTLTLQYSRDRPGGRWDNTCPAPCPRLVGQAWPGRARVANNTSPPALPLAPGSEPAPPRAPAYKACLPGLPYGWLAQAAGREGLSREGLPGGGWQAQAAGREGERRSYDEGHRGGRARGAAPLIRPWGGDKANGGRSPKGGGRRGSSRAPARGPALGIRRTAGARLAGGWGVCQGGGLGGPPLP